MICVLNYYSFNDSKTESGYIQQTLNVRADFDPQQKKVRATLGQAHPNRAVNDFVSPKAKSGPKQSSSSNLSLKKVTYRPLPASNFGSLGNYDSDENLSNNVNSDQ